MFDIEYEIKQLPDTAGVYIMKNSMDEIIYVGKAVNLKNRVSQYFKNSSSHSIKVKQMVQNIASFEYILTNSNVEALSLECNLIKTYKPKYNIKLKDDKHYPYIKIDTNNSFPKIIVTRTVKKDGAKYFGPYTDAKSMWEYVELIKKMWSLRSCNKNLPRDIGKNRACLNYHIGQCKGVCIGEINQEQYKVIVDEITSFLKGNYKEIIKIKEQEMFFQSEQLDFEKALILRDQIQLIKNIEQKHLSINNSLNDQDIIAFAKGSQDTLIQVYFVRKGKLVGREHFMFKNSSDDKIEDIFRNFVMQFYNEAIFIPKEIIVQVIPAEQDTLLEFLTYKKGSRVNIVSPKKGDKHNLLELAIKNAQVTFHQFGDQLKKKEERILLALEGLQELLELPSVPTRIEAYDISNIQGVYSVGGRIVFENGKPNKKDYRKYKIKSTTTPDDYLSMQEVLERRLSNIQKMPDLLLIDGGKGHVNAVKQVLLQLNLEIPICGMVKDENHKTKDLIFKEKELNIDKRSEVFKLINRIQDEVHHFALEYHKNLRNKGQLQSELDNIKGVGKVRKKILLNHFKSIANIKKATSDEIATLDGISSNLAGNIYKYFN
ncbi:excinuclease ABC subunit C [Candidatus Epulonipiscium fishelsonii]|uniref:Excinuclease ABC subunit C n=1 Tax=Candidatus Epulonipiscium fishelsonii TaxID=77094 RepID=A0ACC8X895_9FIRM|nr:excinuclease ABC subunit C [Epulopiscium sp. SCG-B11WGA-EpuloA1]ONI41133.1 excinuclease ABC subunit C [Epulopiscium sp. SCG-B05WGA-EpuloA1]